MSTRKREDSSNAKTLTVSRHCFGIFAKHCFDVSSLLIETNTGCDITQTLAQNAMAESYDGIIGSILK